MAANLSEFVTQTTMRLNATTMLLAEEQDTLGGVEIFGVVMMSAIIILAFQGNLFIIIVISINPQLRASMANIFIINLCVVDLLASILAIPLSVATFVHGFDALKKEICEISAFFSTFVMIASMLSLCVISVERFYSIALPMHHAGHATPCMYIFAVLSIWAIGLALALLPWLGVNSYSFRPAKRICSYYWQGGSSNDRAFIVIIFTISFLIPSIILITMYVGIFRVARKAATSVGPHPSGAIFKTIDPEVGAQNTNLVTTQNNSPAEVIFTVSSPEKNFRTLPKINVEGVASGNSSGLTRQAYLNELSQSGVDSGIRTAEVTDAVSNKAFSVDNNNVKAGEVCRGRSLSQGENHQEVNCSKFMCVCKRTSIHCIAGPSILTSNRKVSQSNNGHAGTCQQTDQPQLNHSPKALPQCHVISHDPVKVKASHMKAFKTLMIIVLSYFVLWSPYFICLLYDLTHRDTASTAMELVATWFSFSSYAINPCLYGLMNRLIREELSQLLKCLFCLCCDSNHGHRRCRHPCQKLSEDEDVEIDDACLGGAESFYQFLQRTQASDATPPEVKGERKGTLTRGANAESTEFNSNNISSENQNNGMF